MTPPYAVAGVVATVVIVAIVLAILVVGAFGYYTYRGSAINAHPNDGLDGAPEASEPSRASGHGRIPEDSPDDFGPDGGLSSHGTK